MTTATDVLPEWFTELRAHQSDALEQIEIAFEEDGAQVVFLDAPTGSGKTLIGEMARRQMGAQALYVCSDKSLQDQFMTDFPYAALLKGRNNYPTENNPTKTADDCQGRSCLLCESAASCPYNMAKARAAASDLAVLNTSYWLHEANGQQPTFGGKNRRDLAIIDEADVLENSLMGFVEFEVPQWIAQRANLSMPPKSVRKPRLVKWLRDASERVRSYIGDGEQMDAKTRQNLWYFVGESLRVATELEVDIAASEDDDEDSGKWQRDYDTKILKLRPLIVAPYGNRYLWRHAKRFLIMSATIISAQEMVDSLGIGMEWAEVVVPMTFPVENRPIVIAPVVNVTYQTTKDPMTAVQMANAIMTIYERDGGPMLVHTGSYRWNNMLVNMLDAAYWEGGRPPIVSYTTAGEKASALRRFRENGGILLSPSMSRGVDLKDDLCRVQVIAKVPFPSLGDKMVSGRLHLPGGQEWYSVQVVRDIVQMTGRGVRSESDTCTTYILDGQFGRLYSRNKSLFPQWWRDAVDQTQSIGWLL